MAHILVAIGLPLTDAHKARFVEGLPGSLILFTDGKAPTPEQLAEAEFIVGNVSPGLLAHAKKLRLLQLQSSGADSYSEGTLPAGAVLCSATGAHGRSVSEHMLASLLTMMKKLHLYRDNQSIGRWVDEGPVDSVEGSTTLIVGLGSIGTSLARQLHALGGRVIGVRRVGTDKPDCVDELYLTDRLDDLLPRADVVALCLPSTKETANIMNRGRIFAMKKGAYLLNTGRGGAVDQEALCDALDQGRLAGAALDVTSPEPLPPGHRLWKERSALITPHVSGGAHLTHTVDTLVEIAIHNVNALLEGKPLKNVVDFATGYRRL